MEIGQIFSSPRVIFVLLRLKCKQNLPPYLCPRVRNSVTLKGSIHEYGEGGGGREEETTCAFVLTAKDRNTDDINLVLDVQLSYVSLAQLDATLAAGLSVDDQRVHHQEAGHGDDGSSLQTVNLVRLSAATAI